MARIYFFFLFPSVAVAPGSVSFLSQRQGTSDQKLVEIESTELKP